MALGLAESGMLGLVLSKVSGSCAETSSSGDNQSEITMKVEDQYHQSTAYGLSVKVRVGRNTPRSCPGCERSYMEILLPNLMLNPSSFTAM
jgi:hypothetical protein